MKLIKEEYQPVTNIISMYSNVKTTVKQNVKTTVKYKDKTYFRYKYVDGSISWLEEKRIFLEYDYIFIANHNKLNLELQYQILLRTNKLKRLLNK